MKRAAIAWICTAALLTGFMTGCRGVPTEDGSAFGNDSPSQSSSLLPEDSSTGGEAPDTSSSIQEDKSAEVLEEMHRLSDKADIYLAQMEELEKPITEGAEKLSGLLEQMKTSLEKVKQADSYNGAEKAALDLQELFSAAGADKVFPEDISDLPEQAGQLLLQAIELQKRAEELLKEEGIKEALIPLKEQIDEKISQMEQIKQSIDLAEEHGKAFEREQAELAVEIEQVLARKKEEDAQKAEEQARLEAAAAQSASQETSKVSQSSEQQESRPADKDSDISGANSKYTRLTGVEEEILKKMNAYRKSLGLSELTRVSSLDDCSAIRVVEMLDNDIFSHTRPDGTSWKTVLDENNIKTLAWAEIQYRQRGSNILKGNGEMASKSIDGWKNSKGHDDIMRSADYSQVGIAAYASGQNVWISNVVFIA